MEKFSLKLKKVFAGKRFALKGLWFYWGDRVCKPLHLPELPALGTLAPCFAPPDDEASDK